MKRVLILSLVIFIIFSQKFNIFAKDSEPVVSADSAVLMDAETGTILYSKNMDNAYPPASTTKTMTALLTLENTNLSDIVRVGKNAQNVEGSRIGIADGEEYTVKDLLYGLFLMSGNDCAVALAEHISGSVENFAKLMNERARELGCEDTNFVNPNGLYDANHKTSAKDLALIMKELSKHAEFKQIASTFLYKTAPADKHPEGINLANENKLIQKNSMYYYEGAEGGKTGYTVQSLHSYVACATRNGQRLIVALVHDKGKSFWEDTIKLFNYGFKNFELVPLFTKGAYVSTYEYDNLKIPLYASNEFYYAKERDSKDIPTFTIPQDKALNAKSFKKGDSILDVPVYFQGQDIGHLKLSSGVDHEFKNPEFDKMNLSDSQNLELYIISGIIMFILFIAEVKYIVKIKSKRYKQF